MEITPNQVQEWFSHPVTNEFFKLIKDKKAEVLEESRYSPISRDGTPMTADACGMQNAHLQGVVESLNEVINIQDEMIEGAEHEENNS